MNRRRLERWSAVFGGCALAGAYYHYHLLAVVVPNAQALVASVLRDTANGTAAAPYQYRFLVPCVLVWLTDHTHLSLTAGTTLLDGLTLGIGAALGVALLRRSGLGLFALPALMYCALLMFGPLIYYKPETFTAFACTTAALLALQRRSPAEGWWSSATVWTVLVVAALILVGCRTDLLFALAVGFAVRWWQQRERVDIVAAATLGMTSLIATAALVRMYPDAHYPRDTGLVQISYNLDALTLCVLGVFLAAAVGPLIALSVPGPLARAARQVVTERLPVLGLISAVVVSSFVVGRVDEIRLIFPVGFALAWVGVELWRGLLSSVEIEERPRSMTLE